MSHRSIVVAIMSGVLLASTARGVDAPVAPTPTGPSGTPTPTAAKPPPPTVERALELRLGTAVLASWSTADLGKLQPLPQTQTQGGKSKLFNLRDAVHKVAGPTARVTAVVLEGGGRVAIDSAAWTDATRIPVLWQNRRGLFKLGWVNDKGLASPGSQELRDVRALELAR